MYRFRLAVKLGFITFAFLFAQVISGKSVPNTSGEHQDNPNILLIISEDNSANLGCYGDQWARTPNLDKLAEQGVRFNNAYITQSVCSSSRSTIFTGLYPHQNGQIGLGNKLQVFEVSRIYYRPDWENPR